MTHDDILHEELLKKGQNKYSTLKKVKMFFGNVCMLLYEWMLSFRSKLALLKHEFHSLNNFNVLPLLYIPLQAADSFITL